MEISYEFSQYCFKQSLDRHYAHFLVFKKQYKNSTVNNYTSYKLAKKSGVSRSNVEKYVAFFIKNGWCKVKDNGSLLFKKVRWIMNEKKITGTQILKFGDSDNVRKILDNIRLTELKQKEEKWKHLKSLGELDESEHKRLSRPWVTKTTLIKRIRKRIGFCAITRPIASRTYSVSLNTISKRIGKSTSTLSRIIKRSEALGELSVTRLGVVRCKNWQEKESLRRLFIFEEQPCPGFFSFLKRGRLIGDFAAFNNSYSFN